MTNMLLENNYCEVTGIIETEPQFNHEIYGEKFYLFTLRSERLSKSFDFINITVSEKLISDLNEIAPGRKIRATGQFRSYNNFSGVGNKLILTLFVKEIEFLTDETYNLINYISLEGFLCKEPVYRVTPFGREITDILLAVNRIHNKSDYLPLICWGRNAKFASTLKIGDKIKVSGRIQSREYQKKLDDEEIITKTAYEISINKIDKII